jgi:GLPGLI family protein
LGTKAIKSSITDAKKQTENIPEVNVKLEIETKEILGYNCKKAILTDGEGNESVYWYTNELNVDKNGQNMMNDKIPGVALEYEINQQGIKMLMSAITVEQKLDKKSKELFEMTIPKGYTEVSAEDLQKLGQ